MEPKDFRDFSSAMTEYIIKYRETIRERNVSPSVEPGYLFSKIPQNAPSKPEHWQHIMEDLERVIMPGIMHWQSPRFHGFYPTASSFPSIVGEMLTAGIGIMGFNWTSSPACTELELAVIDWLAKMINLPQHFLNSSDGPGGGMIQGSASESTLIGLIAAKEKATCRMKTLFPDINEQTIRAKFVSYTSDQANSSVEKSSRLGTMPMRLLPTDKDGRLRGKTLKYAVEEDLQNGLIPCYVVATLGTTGTCAFDCLEEIGHVCKEHSIWLHVDAAYAGSAFICPEYQYLLAGIENVDSLVINAHKWLLVNFDCSAMWLKNLNDLQRAFNVDRIYLNYDSKCTMPDFRNWHISLGCKFRALKLWFTLRLYGTSGLQEHIRKQIALAKYFEQLVREDSRFEVTVPAVMGLVCFRIKGPDNLTRHLLERILLSRRIYMVPATIKELFVLRFVITSEMTNAEDVTTDWKLIQYLTSLIVPHVSEIGNFKTENTKNDNDSKVANITEFCVKEMMQTNCLKDTQL